jgi:subtilisin family serine protease
MSLYIVRPKRILSQSLPLAARSFTLTSRAAQVQEALDQRRADPVEQEISQRLKSMKGATLLTTSETDTPVTGTKVVDMTAEQAERLRAQMPEALVLRDRPIGLIEPVRATTARKAKLTAGDLWHLKSIGLEAARKRGFKGDGDGVTVAVLDTGIDPKHAELAGRVAGAYTFNTAGWASVEQKPSVDTDGHGTHVAGLLCGKRVGVAPGAKLLSGVMLPNGMGNLSDFVLALEWASSRPEVQIVNMSAGIPGYLDGMHTVIADLLAVGVLPVIAVGNEGRNNTRSPGNYTEVVSVGAVNRKHAVWAYSGSGRIVADNHQYNVPDLVAPGEGVYSSVMGGGYEAWDGTSMATPIVSGVAALILQRYPDITVGQLQEEILTSCKLLKADAERQGKGLVQVKRAAS